MLLRRERAERRRGGGAFGAAGAAGALRGSRGCGPQLRRPGAKRQRGVGVSPKLGSLFSWGLSQASGSLAF